MKYYIEQIDRQPIVYMRRTSAYGDENYDLMASLKKWAAQKELLKNSIIYGIAHDGPTTPPEECRYDVCLVTEKDFGADPDVQTGQISGGKYAIFTLPHTAEAVQQFWNTIFVVLQQEKLPFDITKPILERYRQDLVHDGNCEFCVPLVQSP